MNYHVILLYIIMSLSYFYYSNHVLAYVVVLHSPQWNPSIQDDMVYYVCYKSTVVRTTIVLHQEVTTLYLESSTVLQTC